MFNKSISLYLFSLVLLASCFPKDEEFEGTYLPGNVLEYGTKKPVEDALVPLFGVVSGDGGLISYLIDTVRTDVDGLFEFRTQDDSPSYFTIGKISKEGYYDEVIFENGQNLFFKGGNQIVIPQIIINPIGYIRFIVQDVDSLQRPFERIGASFILNASGISDEIDEIFDVFGNRHQKISILEVEGQPLKFDSIYVPSRDTVTYRYLY